MAASKRSSDELAPKITAINLISFLEADAVILIDVDTRVFEIERYIGWGTPKDYEEYQVTIKYWREYTESAGFLPKR